LRISATSRRSVSRKPTGAPPKSLLITSAIPGEGKTFVAANLGIALAQHMDHYALLVDCDLRKPSLHRLLGLGNRRGLVDHLREGVDLRDLILPTGVESLSLIPAGPPPVNPSELIGSQVMQALVEETSQRYPDRIVIFDSPPVQAVSETAVLAQFVDAVIVVVRWGGSRREHVRDLVDEVGRDRIVAVVFNGYKTNIFESKVFGYYEYQYSYRYGAK